MTDHPRTRQLHTRNPRLFTGALITQAINAGLINAGLITLLMVTFDLPLALSSGAEGHLIIAKILSLLLLTLLTAALPLITVRQARAGLISTPLTAVTLLTGLLTFPIGTICAGLAASTLRRA